MMHENTELMESVQERTIRERLGCNRAQVLYFVPWGTVGEMRLLIERIGEGGFWHRRDVAIDFFLRFKRNYSTCFGGPEPYDYIFQDLFTEGIVQDWLDQVAEDTRIKEST